MFLRKLSLANIRSVASLELDFVVGNNQRSWTYLLGENGSGKSSVLKAIGLVLAGSDSVHELVGEPDDWIKLGTDQAFIAVELATKDGEIRHARLEFQRGMRAIAFTKYNEKTLHELDRAITHSDRNYFVVGYGVARHALSSRGGAQSDESSSRFSPRGRSMATLFNLD